MLRHAFGLPFPGRCRAVRGPDGSACFKAVLNISNCFGEPVFSSFCTSFSLAEKRTDLEQLLSNLVLIESPVRSPAGCLVRFVVHRALLRCWQLTNR